ncbi:MAG: GntR family transcriptional regulator [Dehalococcoidia bacterium]
MISFHLDARSGLPTYLQLTQQVKRALLLGVLVQGDQLPTAKEVVGSLAINPNTVLKAYRELEREGLVEGRPGVGTFVVGAPAGNLAGQRVLRAELASWLRKARRAGLDEESIAAVFDDTVRNTLREASA